MYVSVNKKNEIKMVGVSTDPNLTALYINDENNPFDGWSSAKICCYKVNVKDGIVMMLTPYVPSNLIEHFDMLGVENKENADEITIVEDGLAETYEAVDTNTSDIDICMEGIAELYEMLG